MRLRMAKSTAVLCSAALPTTATTTTPTNRLDRPSAVDACSTVATRISLIQTISSVTTAMTPMASDSDHGMPCSASFAAAAGRLWPAGTDGRECRRVNTRLRT